MKKVYSDVISDMLHPSMDPVKHVQMKSLERNPDIYCLFESEIDIDESHEDKMDEQSHVEPREFDPLKKKRDAVLNWFHLLEQMNALPNMGHLEGADSDQAPRQPVAALTNGNPNLKYEESTLMENSCLYEVSELTSLGKEDYFGDSLQSEFVDCDDKVSDQFPNGIIVAASAPGEEFQLNDNVITFPNIFVGDLKCLSDSSSVLKSSEMISSMISSEKSIVDLVDCKSMSSRESFLAENSNENSSDTVSLRSHDDLAWFFPLMMLPSSPSTSILPQKKNKVSETRLTSSTSVQSLDLIDSSALRSTEISCSVVSSEKNITDMADFSSKFPLSGSFLVKGSNENSTAREVSCNNTVDVAGFVYDTVLPSSLSSATLSGEKSVETGLFSSVLSSESIGPLDDSNDVVSISSIETIALCDNVKLEDGCVDVDDTAVHAVSCTLRKNRSYKQMFWDALIAKKDLAKGYEQLAIWVGDAAMGSNKESVQSLLPSTTTTTLGCENLQTELEGDSGWELL